MNNYCIKPAKLLKTRKCIVFNCSINSLKIRFITPSRRKLIYSGIGKLAISAVIIEAFLEKSARYPTGKSVMKSHLGELSNAETKSSTTGTQSSKSITLAFSQNTCHSPTNQMILWPCNHSIIRYNLLQTYYIN